MSGQKPTQPGGRRTGPEARTEALLMLSEGFSVTAVAKKFGVKRGTIIQWRDCPDGQVYLAELRRARKARFEAVLEDGLLALKERASKAIEVLAGKLDSPVPFEAIAAARDILDRAGILRAERVVGAKPKKAIDYSRYTVEELRELKRLRDKGRAG